MNVPERTSSESRPAEASGEDRPPSGNHPQADRVAEDVSSAVAEAPERVAPTAGARTADASTASDRTAVDPPESEVEERVQPERPAGAPPPAQIFPGESGDEIFNRLILPEVEIMWRVALSLTRNPTDAEDVVQESLLRAYRAIHTFDGRYPRAWLLTILRNTERNRHRRRRPELLSDPNMAEERGPATDADAVEQYAEDREFDDAVARSLLELPENFRQVIELVDVDGLSYQESADLLDIPLGTVMSRLHRARRRIRDLLIPLGYGPQQHNDDTDGSPPGPPADSPEPAAGSPRASGSPQAPGSPQTTGSRVEDKP